jgi:hypothetical protein
MTMPVERYRSPQQALTRVTCALLARRGAERLVEGPGCKHRHDTGDVRRESDATHQVTAGSTALG